MSEVALQTALPTWPQQRAARCAERTCAPAPTVPDSAAPAAQPATPSAADTQTSSLQSISASLRRAVHAVSDLGRWLDRVGDTTVAAYHAVSKQRAAIEIKTQEGDVIRIRYSNRVQVDAAAGSATGAEGSASVAQVSSSTRERLRVSVAGNLNVDELAAVNAVLTKIDSLATDFFAGDVESAFAAAANLNVDNQQLATVAVRLSQRASVRAVVASTGQQTPAAVTAPNEADATQSEPLPTEPVPTEPATSASSVASVPVLAPTVVESVPAVVGAPSTESEAANAAPESNVAPTEAMSAEQPKAEALSQPATVSIVNYVAKLRLNLQITGQEARLGLTSTDKLQLLLANLRAQRPDENAVNKLAEVASAALPA